MSDFLTTPTPSPSTQPSSVPSWQEQDGQLREMWMQNKTPQAISEALGRSVSAIMTRAARLGLPRRAAPGRKSTRQLLADGSLAPPTQRRAMPRISQPSGETTPQTSPRICLMCLNTFQSQGRHNRICPSCKNSSEYVSASTLSDIHLTTP